MGQRAVEGAFFKVPIDENYHTYCRIIYNRRYAFYDFRTESDDHSLEEIERAKILLKIIVHRSAIHKGNWKKIGVKPLPEELNKPVPFFIQEIGRPEICWIDLDGERTMVNPSDCIDVERFAVWEYQHVQEYLRDYYDGVPNKNAELLRVNGMVR